MYFIYSLIYTLAFFLLIPYFLVRELSYHRYWRSFFQRLGFIPRRVNPHGRKTLWVHAVSVGEALAAKSLVEALRRGYSNYSLIISTTTVTGNRIARQSFPEVDGVVFFPFDWSFSVRRTLKRLNPILLVILETELWPNALRQCRKRGIPIVLINGRLSPRSYGRYLRIRTLFRRVLKDVDLYCMQSEEDARRIISLGAPDDKVVVTGNLKYDTGEPPASSKTEELLSELLKVKPEDPVIVAGSTEKGEEELLLDSFRQVKKSYPEAKMILAPRRPTRFDEVEKLLKSSSFSYRRRSIAGEEVGAPDLLLLDTIGELTSAYTLGRINFVGGSLVPTGGHNILEPAVWGKPVVFGKYMDNFHAISQLFLREEGGIQVNNQQELTQAFLQLLEDEELCARMGEKAKQIVRANQGATDRSLALIQKLLPPSARGEQAEGID